jgi:ATP-binding cassette subfamily F protein 3
MIQLINIQKSYGPEPLFTDVTVSLTRGERISLVGRNGSGKSTLLRLILGEEEPDDGEIVIPKGYRIGHLQQHLALTKSTVLEEACVGLREEDAGQEYRAEEMLFGLGFSKADMQRSPQEFSGGFQIRISLVKVLVSDPDLLLFDEPTNYLDVVSVRWFTRFLKSWKKEAILISHDRDFLDAVSTHTMLIHRGVIKKLEGNTHKLYARVAEDEEIHEKTWINQEKKRAQTEAFIDRFRAKASKASAVQSRVKQLEALPQLEELKTINSLEFRFSYEPFESKFILEGNDLAFSYPGTEKRLFSDLNLRMTGTDRLAVIGRNGLGKSTLLRIIASELTPTTGSVKLHQNARIGYFGQTNIQRLDLSKTVEEEVWSANPKLLRSQVRGLCGTMMFSGSSAEKKSGFSPEENEAEFYLAKS